MRRIFVVFILIGILMSSLGATTVSAQTACSDTYTVQRGDYLNKIARQCGITLTVLVAANPQITNQNIIYPGQVLKIPKMNSITGGSIYIVKPGDTLSKIGLRFGVSVDSLLKANSSITNANVISSGQKITLPAGAVQVPTASITPTSGDAGAEITIGVTGFPANTEINISYGLTESSQTFTLGVKTDARGAYLDQMTVPSVVQAGKSYVFVVTAKTDSSIKATTNAFQINSSSVAVQRVTVVRGDTLRTIAAKWNTSVAAILILNPSITNPNLIVTGQILSVPQNRTEALVAITPASGKAGAQIYVVAGGFPANQAVDIDLGLKNGQFTTILDAKTDSTGYVNKLITIPSTAKVGDEWIARVRTTNMTNSVSVQSGTFTVK